MSSKSKISKTKNSKDRLTLKPWLIGFAAIAVLFAIIWLSYYISNREVYVKFKDEGGRMVNTKTGAVYNMLSNVYEARYRVSSEIYGKAGGTELYCVAYKRDNKTLVLDGGRWLATDEEDGGRVYVLDGIDVPYLSDFNAEKVYICKENEGAGDAALTHLEGDQMKRFVECLEEKKPYAAKGMLIERYKVRITSTKYPWLYYTAYLVKCEGSDGRYDYYFYSADSAPGADRGAYAVDRELFAETLGDKIE